MAHGVVAIRKLKVHADRRGALFEPLEPALLAGWRNEATRTLRPTSKWRNDVEQER